MDDELVATIPRDQASRLSDTITGFKHEGLIAIARAYFIPGSDAPTLNLYIEDGTPDTNFAVQTTSSAATKGAPALSVNSVGAAATTGTQIAAASAGLKLAGAAGVAVLIGGRAHFVSSVQALHPEHDHITDTALEEYATSLPAPNPANDAEAGGEPSTSTEGETEGTAASVHRPERHNLASAPRALERTASSAAAEPTVLTEQLEPTALAEPTQHSELAAPEEVTPSTWTSTPSSMPTQKATSASADPNIIPTTTPRASSPTSSTKAAPITSETSETPKPKPGTDRTPEPSRTPDPTPEPTPEPRGTATAGSSSLNSVRRLSAQRPLLPFRWLEPPHVCPFQLPRSWVLNCEQ